MITNVSRVYQYPMFTFAKHVSLLTILQFYNHYPEISYALLRPNKSVAVKFYCKAYIGAVNTSLLLYYVNSSCTVFSIKK